MNYLRDNKYTFRRPAGTGWKKPAGIALAVLVIYIWGSAWFVDALAFVTYPFLSFSRQVSSNFQDSLKLQKDLIAENKKLKAENEKLEADLKKESELVAENRELRNLKENGSLPGNPIVARVLVKPNHIPYDEIILDIGTDSVPDLKEGRLVFADKEVVIGQVEEVGHKYSKVKLYSTSGVKIPVVVGKASEPSIAEGQGSGNFFLTLPRGIEISVGDQIKTSMVGEYVLGYASQVYKDPNNPFQKVLFRSPFNIFELEWVELFND